jgi:hypothetical protein
MGKNWPMILAKVSTWLGTRDEPGSLRNGRLLVREFSCGLWEERGPGSINSGQVSMNLASPAQSSQKAVIYAKKCK